MSNLDINAIFDQLDRDRHLAGYRLEERASPFFKLFLPEVMKECVTEIRTPIIPEFPFLRGATDNRSPKVDFLAASKDGCFVYFIELKTDLNSLERGQLQSLKSVLSSGVCGVLKGLREIAATTSDPQAKRKYSHVSQGIEQIGLVGSSELKPKIVYLLPRPPKRESTNVSCIEKYAKIIYFEEFATAIECHGELGERFACSLRCWAKHDAGSVPPGNPCP